jgi:hypothetical protein
MHELILPVAGAVTTGYGVKWYLDYLKDKRELKANPCNCAPPCCGDSGKPCYCGKGSVSG